MPVNFGNFANGTGKLYAVRPDGNIDTFPNSPEACALLQLEATKSKIIYTQYVAETASNTEQFYSPNYGSRIYFNDSGSAPVHDITGALEITDQIIIDTKNNVQTVQVDDDGIATIVRKSRITVAGIESIGADPDYCIINEIVSDLLPGDIVVIIPKPGLSDLIIEVQDTLVDSGNIALDNHSSAVVVNDGSSVVVLIRGGTDTYREITRPQENILSIAAKTLAAGGGTYYTLDPGIAGALNVDSKRGLVVIKGGATLSGAWVVTGENGTPTFRSRKTIIDIIPDDVALITTTTFTLTVFGILINPIYTKGHNWHVRAWFDDTNADSGLWAWRATLSVKELPNADSKAAFGTGTIGTRNSTNCSAISSNIYRTISHVVTTYGLIKFTGTFTMAVTLAQNAAAKEIINTIPVTYKPAASISWKFLCSVSNGSGDGIKNCIVQITGTVMNVIATAGNSLAIGDVVDISSVQYIAEL